ncbi:unnamed protein product [Nezara viridula]|uniref:Uncharacterized protein n=1 Tax=Nezara viridula TaxID=85310 RepID=A0A9P0E1Q3_NEZVI|nr:unnamed protein product [Nezara viridula]
MPNSTKIPQVEDPSLCRHQNFFLLEE